MRYHDALQTINAKHHCPFCREKEEHKIHEDNYMYIIPARAPYVSDHLLIIPRRHVTLLQELSHKELEALHVLVDTRSKKLHMKHKDVNLLLRDGLVWGVTEKSVNHLHFHLIPDCPVGSEGRDGPEREFLEDQAYTSLVEDIKQSYK